MSKITLHLLNSALFVPFAILFECPNSDYETYVAYRVLKNSQNGTKSSVTLLKIINHPFLCNRHSIVLF